jgi:predicted nuclease of predicted toxin-antitoxin system
LKILLDQGLPRRAAAILRDRGLDAVHAGEAGLSAATDLDIVQWCLDTRASQLSRDALVTVQRHGLRIRALPIVRKA